MSDCDCALRSFWDGPCPEHSYPNLPSPLPATSKFSDYGATIEIEFNKFFDPIIEQAAAELGFSLALSLRPLYEKGTQETPDV